MAMRAGLVLALMAVGSSCAMAQEVAPASAAPGTQTQPQVRADAAPPVARNGEEVTSWADDPGAGQEAGELTADGPGIAMDNMGMETTVPMDLGLEAMPEQPAGMEMRFTLRDGSPDGVVALLEKKTPAEMSTEDSALLDRRKGELAEAAGRRGLDLSAAGLDEKQVVCGAAEPQAVILQFDGPRRFVAVVPRDAGLPVQVLGVTGKKGEPARRALEKGSGKRALAEALPPAVLADHLQPHKDWIATSACFATLGGAEPRVPLYNEADSAMTTAPDPLLRLLVTGERKVVLTDQPVVSQVTVWDEGMKGNGKVHTAENWTWRLTPRAVTNPPLPPVVTQASAQIPEPPVVHTPEPPSPLAGVQQ